MDTRNPTPDRLAASVIAVPPLARNEDLTLNREANRQLIRHIESGGVTTLLYGGNANFYHVATSEYEDLLRFLAETAARETLVIPSAGPAFGTLMDQARVLRNTAFPTVMILPQQGMTTAAGVENGIRQFAEAAEKPVVLYIKHEGYLEPENARTLVDEGLVSWIKYAIVAEDPMVDPFLDRLVGLVDPQMIVSGIGEQPAIDHVREKGLAGFTSGCVCVNPALSQQMLEALKEGDDARAETIRTLFQPLEDLRNAVNPVRVLHDAVTLAGIADCGPVLPLLSNLEADEADRVKTAACELLSQRLEAQSTGA